jgi:hypothetical protein
MSMNGITSDYWDAVGRVALGAPGSAEPRRRSMFENDDAPIPASDLDVVEHEVDARPMTVAATPTTQPAAAPSPPDAAPAASAGTIGDATARPSAEPHTVAAADAAVPRAPRTMPIEVSGGPSMPAMPTAPPHEPVDRLEIHRVETMHTTRELVGPRERTAEPDAAPPSAAVQALPKARDEPREQPRASVVAAPVVAVAAPVAAAAPAAQPIAPSTEPPPLLIEIARIDIRIESEAAAPAAVPRRRDIPSAPSLDDFLTRRRGAGQ